MANEIIPSEIFILILVVILAFVVIIIALQWKKVRQSDNTLKLMEKEIELKKIAMVEKDLENKRLMENPISLPSEQQEQLTQIRDSTAKVMSDVGYLHSEINERLARLEAQTELKKLEKMLAEIEDKEKKLNKGK
ncbi:hypothetical protein mru_2057 [Methanobrevibacter ruminantium M1]|jgi:predicted PurR-regulated permease PerM|uniref:Uncharacterized protein n=1 Tax=Methanobrevibacter ruminantium (strain ATCC 35063 / DSM 1093 / JCM 13430 / OCM 146 / M1) TaxID=634498 RepID=D3E0T3_METRM|nr:hypothetical protein [Methanobrevibacter ruminantium]ADC47907.1 hypothetical protein mru_2057 [Methanobrevibacter ruminantium M1]